MATTITPEQIDVTDDIDTLWSAFLDAKADGNTSLVEALRQRMAELQARTHLTSFDDDQLIAKIENLRGLEDQSHTPPATDPLHDLPRPQAAAEGPSDELLVCLGEAERRGLIV